VLVPSRPSIRKVGGRPWAVVGCSSGVGVGIGELAGRGCGVSAVGRAGSRELVFRLAVSAVPGRRGQVRRGGYLTRRDAVAARDALLDRTTSELAVVEAWTVARWLRYWLSTRTSIRPSTLWSYTEQVERHLIPHLGRIALGELNARRVADMVAAVASTPTRYGRLPSPSTLHRIRATLRSALHAAIREGLLRDNLTRDVEVPSPRRPQAWVWTEHRVEEWRNTGQRFAVGVWTTRQTAAFLGFVAGDRLSAMWWLIALRRLRRGEAAGLRWVDADLAEKVVMIGQQSIAYGHTVAVRPAEDHGQPPQHRPGSARGAAAACPPQATAG
jgi:hypothetical protein